MDNRQTISEDDCLSLITKSLRKGEGFFHLWIGYTGWGKSVANSILCTFLKQHGCMTIVIDQKNKDCIYPGEQIVSVRELPDVKSSQVVIRGAAMTTKASDIVVCDDVARDVWTIGQSANVTVCLMPDELTDASKNQEWKVRKQRLSRSTATIHNAMSDNDPWMDKLYCQGRVLGICIAAATQLVQSVPRSALAMSGTMGIFRQRGRELAYLERLGYLDKMSSQIVSNLAIGEFLLTQRGEEPKVCKFDYSGT